MEVDTPVVTVNVVGGMLIVIRELKQLSSLLERGVALSESRFINRALRQVPSIREHLTEDSVAQICSAFITSSSLLNASDLGFKSTKTEQESKQFSPEVDALVVYLVLLFLHDSKNYEQGIQVSKLAVERITQANRRSLDQIASKILFYYSRFYELTGQLQLVRPVLLELHRLATLRRDHESLATLTNLLLRNYLHFNLYDQAAKLAAKSTWPETAANNQLARYMYYMGIIKAIQLDYSQAHQFLQQAIRKAPQSDQATGFLQSAYKYFIIVQLLMGEIPERSTFGIAYLQEPLAGYLQITRAVRTGDLADFQNVLLKFGSCFKQDKTFTLILRLRHNVIKAGIRMISTAYSRISLKDICRKLKLDSEEDAEFIVAKAIKDGVIDAMINHEKGYMQSKETVNVYSSIEPQLAFDQRISFCLKLHNDSVKAMRYPSDDWKKELAELEKANDDIDPDKIEDYDDDDMAEF